MAIKSEAFGSVTLSGKDAKKFAEQVRSKPNTAAVHTVARGRDMIRAMRDNNMMLTIRPLESKRAGKKDGTD